MIRVTMESGKVVEIDFPNAPEPDPITAFPWANADHISVIANVESFE